MLPDCTSYEELIAQFEWNIPEYFNIGVDVCDKWANSDPDRLAIEYIDEENGKHSLSFGDLKNQSNQIANLLSAHGAERGDRIGILLPQTPETAYAHIAIHKLGGISIPLFALFQEEALAYRLKDSGAKMLITDRSGAAKIAQIRSELPELTHVFSIDGADDQAHDFHDLRQSQSEVFEPVQTKADDPALIIYTSGTTGQPKGALHAHRVLLGHLPGVEMSHDLFPKDGDRIWTPADWAWIGGLLDVLMPALHHGIPVVACHFRKFTGEAAFAFLAEHNIRNAFFPPTALKMMRQVEDPQTRWSYNLRSIASGGETLGTELIEWGQRVFGLTINEFYGQTECNMIVSSCSRIMDARPGIMGRPVPGHAVAIVDDTGAPTPTGTLGNIGVRKSDPIMFLNYWRNADATENKFAGDWLLTGDTGIMDSDGWIQFVGRDDDVITSSGYRIGPGEIEDCLLRHAAIAMAGVVGKPDPLRTEIVKAFVVLKPGVDQSPALAEEIKEFVRTRLAAHEYPREVSFVEALPMTTTGKVIRRQLRDLAAAEITPREPS
ncbi:MAG: acyl-CoA synthetase [Stappiaceae bacterium]